LPSNLARDEGALNELEEPPAVFGARLDEEQDAVPRPELWRAVHEDGVTRRRHAPRDLQDDRPFENIAFQDSGNGHQPPRAPDIAGVRDLTFDEGFDDDGRAVDQLCIGEGDDRRRPDRSRLERPDQRRERERSLDSGVVSGRVLMAGPSLLLLG